MTTEESKVEAIFFAAVEMQSPDELAAYLDKACGENEGLRHRVEALLHARPVLGSFLQGEAAEMVTTSVPPQLETPGTQIGPYKLLQQIGEGGMGVVWMAEQLEPVCIWEVVPGIWRLQTLSDVSKWPIGRMR